MKFYLRWLVSDARVTDVADNAVDSIDSAAEITWLIPRQDNGGLVHEVNRQVLGLGWRLCSLYK